jgi:hypothetical protein
MHHMQTATVVSLDHRRDRNRRMARATAARRHLDDVDRRGQGRRGGGRAWVNGAELGGRPASLAHLHESHD